jgi:hypothetical protein
MGDEYLTMAEIEQRYPNEWVLIDRLQTQGKWGEPLGGHVVWHASDQGTFYERLQEFQEVGDYCAIRYTGKVTEQEMPVAEGNT